MDDLTLEPATTADARFLAAMLGEAFSWRDPDGTLPVSEVLGRPEVARYVEGWGRPGDRGLIANVGGAPAGAVWIRRFTADDHAYGFVDAETPELSIAVERRHRGIGIGRCLLAGILAQAALDGHAHVSLSVEVDNRARRLYERFGFQELERVDGAVTMLATLRAEAR
jgi:ribosomal protein S18 acetylase RimI-like enzyme